MKEEDVRIGMKVVPHAKTVEGYAGLENSGMWDRAKIERQPFLFVTDKEEEGYLLYLSNNNSFGDYFNACDFEPYIDIQEAVDALNRAFNNLNKAFETLQELAEKNRDAIEEFAKKTEKERLEEEIQKSFKLHVKKHGTDFSLFSCYKAGYIAGREGK